MSKTPKFRFEEFADFDVDGACVHIGLEHYPIGPARPAIRINAGAVEVRCHVHHTDIDAMIDGLKAAKRELKKLAAPAASKARAA